MTKQEKIQEAYGEHWEYFKDKQFDENGYSMFEENDNKHKIWEQITLDSHPYANMVYRPSILNGIEHNNGWIKIESEADLPKEEGDYLVINKRGEIFTYPFQYIETSEIKTVWLTEFTHYQPINKPLKPLY